AIQTLLPALASHEYGGRLVSLLRNDQESARLLHSLVRRSVPITCVMTRRAPRPGKLRLSPTRLRLYLFCPKAYHYYYVRGLRWGQMSAGYALGGSLHRTLEAFHREGPGEDVAGLLQQFSSAWSTRGYEDPAEESAHYTAGEEM